MKNILTVVACGAMLTAAPMTAIVNPNNHSVIKKFQPNNLSTWGQAQKQIIYQHYLKTAKYYYHNKWSNHTWIQFTSIFNAMQYGFRAINPNIWFLSPEGKYNVISHYANYPKDNADVKAVLAKGLHVVIDATAAPIQGSITLFIQGKI